MMILEGSFLVPEASNSGANLSSHQLSASVVEADSHSLLSQQENTSNIQIQNLRTCMIRRILKLRSPSRACISNEDIELSLAPLDLINQPHDLSFCGDIGWDADSAATHSW